MGVKLGGKAVEQPNRSTQKLEAKRRLGKKLAEMRRALISAGFDTTSKQAAVFELSRATAWFVLNRDDKAGPSADVVKRILSSAKISSRVRRKFEEYIEEKGLGLYGHDRRYSRKFREQFPEHFPPDHGNERAPVDGRNSHSGDGSGVIILHQRRKRDAKAKTAVPRKNSGGPSCDIRPCPRWLRSGGPNGGQCFDGGSSRMVAELAGTAKSSAAQSDAIANSLS